MIYISISSPSQLKEEFQAYNRDYYSLSQYEAMFDFFNSLGDDYELDVLGLCCDLNSSPWEELYEEFGTEDKDCILDQLSEQTAVLHYDDTDILYFAY